MYSYLSSYRSIWGFSSKNIYFFEVGSCLNRTQFLFFETNQCTGKKKSFNSKLADFEAVVALVDSGKLVPDPSYQSAKLPCKYSYLANEGRKDTRGSIKIIKEGETTIIKFWQRRYGLDRNDLVIYRSDNKDITVSSSYSDEIVKLKDHWFWNIFRR